MAGPIESPNTLISNQRIKIIDLLSEGEVAGFTPVFGPSGNNPLCSIYFDDLTLMNGDGSANWNITGQGFAFSFNSGTSGQAPLVGFEKVEAFVPLPANTRVFNPPINNGYPKDVIATFNSVAYPDAEAVKLTLRFPAVYTVDQSNGNTNAFDFSWAVDISVNNSAYTSLDSMSLSDINPTPKCTSPYLFTKVYTLPKNPPGQTFYEWKLRVRRVSQNILSSNTQNEMFVDSVAIVSSNTYTYRMSAVAGIAITADQFGTIPTRAYDLQGIKVLVPDGYTPTQYGFTTLTPDCDVTSGVKHIGVNGSMDGIVVGMFVSGPGIPDGSVIVATDVNFFTIDQDPTATDPSVILTLKGSNVTITPASYPGIWLGGMTERKWTDNPAWIFYDLVTNKRYGLGKYIRPEWVDKWTLYQIAQYCDEMVDDGAGGLEPRFTCNVAILETQDAYTLLNNLVSVFQGMLYWAGGRIFPVGSENRDAVFTFTNANVIGGSFSYSDTPRNTRSTVCTVKWLDPDNLFRPTPERIEDIDGITKYGYLEKQLTAFATTSRGQAIRAANWFLTVEQVLTETISFQTDMEGFYLRPGDVFTVYDNYRNNQKQGGRILGWGTGQQTIYLDKPTTLEPGFTYYLSAIVPAATYTATGDITGSNDISLIRNSQLETRQVLTASPAANITTLELHSGFSSALFRGSPWTLSASGDDVTVFDQATPYKCLVTSEPRPGTVEVLGVQYSTGINYRVNTQYSVEVSPPQIGDTVTPNAPTGIAVARITGIQTNNQFFDYLYISWSGSTSSNNVYYTLSGQLDAGSPFIIAQPLTTGQNYTPTAYGTYTFSVASNNANAYQSAFNQITYVRNNVNPFGNTAPLAGVQIISGYDPYYIRSTDGRYTGYQGRQPTFAWNPTLDDNGNYVPTAQFITGYRCRLLKLGDEATIMSLSDISLSGLYNNVLTLDPDYLFTGTTANPLRGFTFSVDTVDQWGNIKSGARLAVNNPVPPPPLNSGFVGYNGGFDYNVTPRTQADTSGVYIWQNNTASFTPTYDNVDYISTNMAASVNIGPAQGSTYLWYAVTDSFGFSGSKSTAGDMNCPIYGPISGNANAIVGDLFAIWNPAITGTYALVTGLTYTFATGNGALAQSVQGLIAAISGTYSKIAIVAEAFVTGSPGAGWTNNKAVARYGFKLDANGKVVSMVATAANFGIDTNQIVFGGADLLSDNYSAGSAGWKIGYNGNVEFNEGTFRGSLVINSGTASQITAIPAGLRVGRGGAGTIGSVFMDTSIDLVNGPSLKVGGPTNYGVTLFATAGGDGAGTVTLNNGSSADVKVRLQGIDGSVSGRLIQAGPHFQAGPSSVDITGVNFRIYDASTNQRFRVDNTNGYIYVQGTQVVRNQYSTPLVTLTDVINCLTYHGLGV